MGAVTRKSEVDKVSFVLWISGCLLHGWWVPCDLGLSFSSWSREGDNCSSGNFLGKCTFLLQKSNFSFVFRASSLSVVSQNNPVPKRYVFSGAYSNAGLPSWLSQ